MGYWYGFSGSGGGRRTFNEKEVLPVYACCVCVEGVASDKTGSCAGWEAIRSELLENLVSLVGRR